MLFLKNGQVHTMMGEILNEASILVDNGKIKEIGTGIVEPKGVRVVNLHGKVVTPGIIEAHCHLGMQEDSIGFEGNDVNETSDPVTPQLRAIDAINPMDKTFKEAYEGGVTCAATGPGSANVIGGQFIVIKTYGDRIDDMVVKDPVAMKCAFGENPKKFYGQGKKQPATRMAIAAMIREYLRKAKDYSEKLEEAKDDKSKRPAFDAKLEALVPVVNREIPLKAHVHRADDIFTAIRIAKEFGVKMTLDHCTDGSLIANELAKENFDVIVGPSFGYRGKFELKSKSFETPGILSRAGLKVAITTDSPVVPLNYLPMSAGLAVKAGMDKEEALKAITINAAEILGVDDRVGSLEVGKDADIVVWDGHPCDLSSTVNYTIINGEIVYSNME
ncbi:amidohydrolase [Clostridium sp. BSD9I1]|uniref:amidohydrolase n=1 Tax=Clostridium sp. BSD9I1 TaxID=2003589 RepID=UPI001647D9A0|nr:amidohydrolase [Clostridium sp. BSD9I1]